MVEENRTASVKIGVFQHWMLTLQDILYEIEEFEYDLKYQCYEIDVTQRLYDATEDEKERKHWQKQIDRIDKAISTTETRLAKLQKQAGYCEAMLAIIRSDLEVEGIDPDTCNLDEFLFDDEFDDEFDADFDEDDIPF
jgi:predicted RNase H-like nuclease (RuvC/YqgF family)